MTTDAATLPDFDPFSVEDIPTGEVRIKDPSTGERTAWVVMLAGPEHPDRKARAFARQRKLRNEFYKTQKLPKSDPAEDFEIESEEIIESILGWTGTTLPFSKDNVRALINDPKRQWFRQQIKAALDDREAFTRGSAQT